MENITEQIEEIKVLSAIYGHNFLVVDKSERIYKIRVPHEHDSWPVTLQVLLPPEYPSKTHPFFEIHSAWMSEADKIEVSNLLNTISHHHHGEIVLYQWIEALRTFIDNKLGGQREGEVPPPSSHLVTHGHPTTPVYGATYQQPGAAVPSGQYSYLRSTSRDAKINSIDILLCHAEELEPRILSFSGRRGDKEFIFLDEQLTKLILELDKVQTGGLEEIQAARKSAVQRIQFLINTLESKA